MLPHFDHTAWRRKEHYAQRSRPMKTNKWGNDAGSDTWSRISEPCGEFPGLNRVFSLFVKQKNSNRVILCLVFSQERS